MRRFELESFLSNIASFHVTELYVVSAMAVAIAMSPFLAQVLDEIHPRGYGRRGSAEQGTPSGDQAPPCAQGSIRAGHGHDGVDLHPDHVPLARGRRHGLRRASHSWHGS